MSHPLWSDEYWLLLLQLYQRKPAGIKPLYSRGMVELSLELHIPPHYLYEQMFRLRRAGTPHLERLWATYGENPRRLSRDIKKLRSMAGFSNAAAFYEGVAVNESFESDFRPVPSCGGIMPMMLIIILDLYFRLTPATMVRNTPEIAELAKLMGMKADTVVEVMETFQTLDPYLNRKDTEPSQFTEECRKIWKRYGNGNPEELSSLAAQLKAYFK